jgi:preprotein translocase subunit YajC
VKQNKVLNLVLIVGFLISLLALMGGCYPTQTPTEPGTTPPEGGGGFDYTIIIFIVLIIAVFYFLMIRPQRKRQKDQQQLMEGLKRGDKVITAGGIFGVIENVSEDSVVIKVESGATMRVAKSSVAVRREQ